MDDAVQPDAGDRRYDQATALQFILAYAVYIAVTRMMLSIVLFTYARRVDLNFVWTLYANQLLNAVVKVYMQWRLAKQKWANRGNQKAGFAGDGAAGDVPRSHGGLSDGALVCLRSFLIVMIYTKLLTVPSHGLRIGQSFLADSIKL